MLSAPAKKGLPRLVNALGETLQALTRLDAAVAQLRPERTAWPRFPTFSVVELNHLRCVIRQGCTAITSRGGDLMRPGADALLYTEFGQDGMLPELGMPELGRPPEARNSRALLAAYRTACRAVCTSLQEARRSSDSVTAAMLSSLLQRLEKQLWLLDSSPQPVRIGLPTIDLFLAC